MLLGGHPSISTLGEVHRLYISANKTASPHLCSCGLHVLDCSFWQNVQENLSMRLSTQAPDLLRRYITTDPKALEIIGDEVLWEPPVPRRYSPDINKLAMLAGSRALWWLLRLLAPSARLHYKIARNSHLLYDAVRDEANTPIVIDATKNPNRLKGLYLQRPEETYILYLVRDGRAVTSSRLRRHQVDMRDAAKVWTAEHKKVRLALATIPNRRIKTVKYEQLCQRPADVLSEICEFLELDYDPRMLNFRTNDHHRLGGNPMRHRKNDKTISFDDRWRTELGDTELSVFNRIAGKTNRTLGYD